MKDAIYDIQQKVRVSIASAATLVLLIWVMSACGVPQAAAPAATDGPSPELSATTGERRMAGIIDFYTSGTNDVIAAPSSVRVGEDVQVTVTTFGGGCERAGGVDVTMTSNTATLAVYDYSTAGPDVACTTELKRMPRTVTLRFPASGQAVIRVEGTRMGPETPPAGIPTFLEHRLAVQ